MLPVGREENERTTNQFSVVILSAGDNLEEAKAKFAGTRRDIFRTGNHRYH